MRAREEIDKAKERLIRLGASRGIALAPEVDGTRLTLILILH